MSFGERVPELPGAIGAMHGSWDAREMLWGTGVGAKGGTRCHRADCGEDYIGGLNMDDARGALFTEVDLLDCNYRGFCE